MIRSVEGFTYALILDLNMGYYCIKLDADAQRLVTITSPRIFEIFNFFDKQGRPKTFPGQDLISK
jgi:hypothetical protein